MTKHVGILTAGGDSPGLNAAIRSVGKTATGFYDMQLLGIQDGFRGLVENRVQRIGGDALSGILTVGGTILGTSRDKPHKMLIGGKVQDMTEAIIENYHANHLDVLVCLGGIKAVSPHAFVGPNNPISPRWWDGCVPLRID